MLEEVGWLVKRLPKRTLPCSVLKFSLLKKPTYQIIRVNIFCWHDDVAALGLHSIAIALGKLLTTEIILLS